jgi:hypothetical protein
MLSRLGRRGVPFRRRATSKARQKVDEMRRKHDIEGADTWLHERRENPRRHRPGPEPDG